MKRIFKVCAAALPLVVGTLAWAQSRSAGDFVPELTLAPVLYFPPNPDGGEPCVASQGIVRTDAGFEGSVQSFTVCPRTAAQAARVDACQSLAIRLVNGARGWVDGGI